ncbi:MAG TPA: NADPH:quinone reductase [Chthonomonadaceae bacterium]|nr:NADPH:quinone reductase [Chthonomonadaceae bacterium]
MKAIQVREFGGPEVLQLVDVPDPKPAAGQVLVRAHAVGVNPVETYVRSGNYPKLPPLPYTPGADAAGVVEAVGEGVYTVAPGERVYIYGSLTGAYAERILCEPSQVHPLPDRVSFSQGAGVGIPVGAAWRALFYRGKAQPGETVLVHGASGAVGIAAVQLARAAGLTVIGTAGSEEGRALVREQGAHHVFGHDVTDDPPALAKASSGRGVDLIIEMLANRNLAKDLGAVARQGRIVVVGSRGPIEIDPRMTMSNEVSILGMTITIATPEELRAMHASIGAALEAGTLRPIVAEEMPLADAPRAHVAVMESDKPGKIVLRPSQ